MRAVDIIARKRDGLELTAAEIGFFVRGIASGDIPDYQVAAWAMAVLLRGMSTQETIDLTLAMVDSGDTLDLSKTADMVVDKHSTGGVGDKTTLVVAPLVAAAGLTVAKMSGRGLGFSGGTLDKLEAIPGFQVNLENERFLSIARQTGIVVAGQTSRLVPADARLYALRDVTATVPSLPLIASSIMSKKIASGAQAMVLDVKVGRGAFMETLCEARALAKMMIDIGHGVSRRVTCVLSDMSQPLGRTVGNALEVQEAIDTLRGAGSPDFIEQCLTVGAEMLVLGDRAANATEARVRLNHLVDDGHALARFRAWVAAQGGNPNVVDDPGLLPQAPVVLPVLSPASGWVTSLDPRQVGNIAVALGAGRERKGDPIDHAVGIILGPKMGDRVATGDLLCTIHARTRDSAVAAHDRLLSCYAWSDRPPDVPSLIHDILRDHEPEGGARKKGAAPS